MVLDPQTTIFMICFVYLMLHASIWLALLEHRNFQIDLWCGAGVVSGVGVVWLALRGYVSEFAFIYLGQLFMLAGNWGRLVALRLYLAPDSQRTAYAVYTVVNVAYYVVITYVGNVLQNDWLGLILHNGFYALLCFDYFRIGHKLHQRRPTLGARLLMGAGLVLSVSLGLRSLGVALDGEVANVYEASWHQVQMIVSQFIAITLSNIAFLRIYLEIAERKKLALAQELTNQTHRADAMQQTSMSLKQLLQEREEIIRQLALFNKTAGMGALVASLAHELNQPLTAIQLNAELIDATMPADEASKAAMRDLMNDNQRAATIIRTLRNMFGSGRKSNTEFDVHELVHDVLLLCKAKLTQQQIHVDLALHAQPIRITADKSQLQQVLLNLITNAMDAFEPHTSKPKRIQIGTRLLDHAVELTVSDNGMGIAPPIAASMFELLRTNKDEGMGVGLWLSKTIVESHHGTIDYETSATTGTVFCVRLPISHDALIY